MAGLGRPSCPPPTRGAGVPGLFPVLVHHAPGHASDHVPSPARPSAVPPASNPCGGLFVLSVTMAPPVQPSDHPDRGIPADSRGGPFPPRQCEMSQDEPPTRQLALRVVPVSHHSGDAAKRGFGLCPLRWPIRRRAVRPRATKLPLCETRTQPMTLERGEPGCGGTVPSLRGGRSWAGARPGRAKESTTCPDGLRRPRRGDDSAGAELIDDCEAFLTGQLVERIEGPR